MKTYKVITIDFNGYRTERATTGSKDTAKAIYESYIVRCLKGFADIMKVLVETDTEIVSGFVNWRR